MANLNDPEVRQLLEQPHHAVLSTFNADGTILSTVVWISAEDGVVAVNSAEGRRWPGNLRRDPRVTALVYETGNPYNYVEIQGTASESPSDADEHIDRLSQKFIGQAKYPFRQPGEQRVKFTIQPHRVRHQRQG